jgi:hypothetical protein
LCHHRRHPLGLDPTAVRSERCQTATTAAVKSEYATILTGIRLLPDSRTKILFLTGVFIVCMRSLMLQIMETRMLSVIAWYYTPRTRRWRRQS